MERYRKRRIDKCVRSKVVGFKVTEEEYNMILNLCKKYNLTKAELMIRLILELNNKREA